ncbi:MAG: hypothetical protein HY613_02930 [Candidatus Rokubacteria bacterium]|nr:hypothetical protein [Candidatus Rokubacteria bacterium]
MKSEADAIEELHARGLTDGLPVVLPAPARVRDAVAASGRSAAELIALVPPRYGRATVEKVAVNAVMAGCRPEYLSVVIAGVEAMCDDAFGLLGISGTTDAVAPLFLINGPVRRALDINSGVGLFGPGWRANATIGRALRLIWVNIGGAKPGVISMSTFSQPGRYTYCIGENEEANPWEPFHVEHGFAPGDSTVAVLAGEAPHVTSASTSRTARDLLLTIARSLEVVGNHKVTALGDTLIIFSPEHARTIAGDGWSKADVRSFLWERLRKPVKDLLPGRDGGEGLRERMLAGIAHPETDETPIPKFRAPENLKIVVAGGTAGRFTAVVAGWPFPNAPTGLVIKKIRLPARLA